jgi:hypothetical protein
MAALYTFEASAVATLLAVFGRTMLELGPVEVGYLRSALGVGLSICLSSPAGLPRTHRSGPELDDPVFEPSSPGVSSGNHDHKLQDRTGFDRPLAPALCPRRGDRSRAKGRSHRHSCQEMTMRRTALDGTTYAPENLQ